MSKVLEQMAKVTYQHLKDNHLSNRQFGFWAGRSTADLLTFLFKNWHNVLIEGLDNLVVSLDILGAFDRDCRKASSHGYPGELVAPRATGSHHCLPPIRPQFHQDQC